MHPRELIYPCSVLHSAFATRYYIKEESYSRWTIVSDYFHLAKGFWDTFTLQGTSTLFYVWILFHSMAVSQFINSSPDGCLGCFHLVVAVYLLSGIWLSLLPIINSSAMNICVQLFVFSFWIPIFNFEKNIPKREIAESYGNSLRVYNILLVTSLLTYFINDFHTLFTLPSWV